MAFALGVCSAAWVAGIVTAVLVGADSGLPWYRVVPLGLVERGLAVTEVAALLALGVWGAARLGPQGGDEVLDVAAEDGGHVHPVRVDQPLRL